MLWFIKHFPMVMETVSLYNNMTDLSDWLTCRCLPIVVVWSLNLMHLFIEFICKTFKALYIGELIRTMLEICCPFRLAEVIDLSKYKFHVLLDVQIMSSSIMLDVRLMIDFNYFSNWKFHDQCSRLSVNSPSVE